ncbi:MAG: helix-turn-helix domain-containing protein [Terracidiphilus sp.]
MKLNRVDADYLGVKEAEIMTGVSRWTWRRWAYDGRIGSVKLGSRLLIPTSEVQRMIEEGARPARPAVAV